jgi:predicted CXXCH cytochrome family protein
MKKALLTVAALLVATSAYANSFTSFKGSDPGSIVNTRHDLGASTVSGIYFGGTEKQICVYCHTPHNAVASIKNPLWNRTYAPGTTNGNTDITALYVTSPTLTNQAKAATVPSGSVSSLCLSCHTGDATNGSMSTTKNNGLSASATEILMAGKMGDATTAGFFNTSAKLGADLSDDHPIGFDYEVAAAEDFYRRLRAADDVELLFGKGGTNKGLRNRTVFYANGIGTGTATRRMECASCHSVHDDSNPPFLRISNARSALCLACHLK